LAMNNITYIPRLFFQPIYTNNAYFERENHIKILCPET